MKKSQWFSPRVVIALFCLTFTLAAQTERGSITGRITDPSGAVVSDAVVKVINVDTNSTFETKTSGDGLYVTPSILKPGRYKVEASHSGFKTVTSDVIVLQIGAVQEINLALQVGAQSEQVTVNAEAPILQTETSNRGEVITGREVTELPLKDRNFTNLALLTPGVSRALVGVLVDQTAFNQGDPNAGSVPGMGDSRGSTEAARFSRSAGASISANGLRPTNNNFSLDGVDNNEPQFGTIGVFPNPDAIAEFKVETSVGKAETGRGGATVNTTYQSGTNSFHGSAYYYGQHYALNAAHPVLKFRRTELLRSGTPLAQVNQQLGEKSKTEVNEFGGTFGGPIFRNRTFFFVDYLGQRNKTPHPFTSTVPSAKSRTGDFSEFTNAVKDPLTGVNFPGNCVGTFAGGTCTPNLKSRADFSPQGFALLNAYPLPNIPGVINADSNSGRPNFVGTRNNQERINSFDVKIDHRLTSNNNLSGRYSFSNQKRVRANFFPVIPTAGFGAGDELGNTRQVVASDSHAFRPTLLNEVRFGWTSIEIGIHNCGVLGACGVSPTFCSDIGIPNCNKGTPATTGGILTGGFGSGFFEFTGDGGLFQVQSDNYYIADNVTIISGKHAWKVGGEARPRFLNTFDGGRSGFVKGSLNYGDNNTGNAQLDAMLKSVFPPQASSGSVLGGARPFQLRATEWSFFVQDDWKVGPSLVLNLGIRYDLFPGFHEANKRLANYNVATGQIIRASGSGDSTINRATSNIGPRVGFAYSFGPSREFVLRGGYGLFYAQDGIDYPPVVRNPPLTSTVGFNNFGGTSNTQFNLTNGPPVAPLVDPPVIAPETRLFSLQTSQRVATIHEWNLTYQAQLAPTVIFDLGYVGTRSRHLLATRQVGNINNGLGLAKTTTVSPTCAAPPCFINDVTAYENRGSSNYDGLQASLEKRFSRGLQAHVIYTWSHGIDDSTGVFNGGGDQRNNAFGPINPLNLGFDRASSSLDHRNAFTSSIIYDLPFGKGRRFGNGAGSVPNAVIGGWQANFLFSGSTGQHFTVQADTGKNYFSTAQIVGDPFSGTSSGPFLNKAAFKDPTAANGATCVRNLANNQICFGNSGRNRFTGPGYFRTDFSMFKNLSLTERWKMQLGVEFFNLLNHNNPIVPETSIESGDFGIFRNALPPRTVQYRAKLLF